MCFCNCPREARFGEEKGSCRKPYGIPCPGDPIEDCKHNCICNRCQKEKCVLKGCEGCEDGDAAIVEGECDGFETGEEKE